MTVFRVARRVFAFWWPVTVGEGGSGLGVLESEVDDLVELMSVPYFSRNSTPPTSLRELRIEGRSLIGLV